MKKLLIFLLYFGLWLKADAQNIVQYQYWYDSNYSNAAIVNSETSGDLNLSTSLTGTSGLTPGLHNVNFRAKDTNGKWSAAITEQFYATGNWNIESYEYWYDDNYSNKIVNAVTPSQNYILASSLNTSAVGYGAHALNFRSRDSAGKWSIVIKEYFFKSVGGTQLSNAEYWIDNNFAGKQPITFTSSNIVFINQSLLTSNLDDKLHTFNFRMQDQSGKWSVASSSYFMAKSLIVSYDYWFDTDFEHKITTAVTPTNLLTVAPNFNTSGLSIGTHIVNFRAKNSSGKYSTAISQTITVTTSFSVTTTIKSTLWNTTVVPNKYLTYQPVALPSGATITKYGVEVTNMTSNEVGVFESTSTSFRLIDASPSVASYGTSFSIKVKLQVNGTWLSYGIAKVVTTAPLPPIATLNTLCGQTMTTIDQVVYCTTVPLATNYTFEISSGASIAIISNTLNNFKLTNLDFNSFPILYNTPYSVRIKVKSMVNGSEVESAWSSPCTITTPTNAPLASIISGCGVVANGYSLIKCTTIKFASEYKFVLVNGSSSLEIIRPYNSFSLNMISGIAQGTSYTVTPFYKLYGQWYSGNSCNVTAPGTALAKTETTNIQDEFLVKAYPNPFAENFKLNVISSFDGTLQVKVYDVLGKLIETKTLNLSDIQTLEIGSYYPSGVYNVVINQDDKTQSLRVIKR